MVQICSFGGSVLMMMMVKITGFSSTSGLFIKSMMTMIMIMTIKIMLKMKTFMLYHYIEERANVSSIQLPIPGPFILLIDYMLSWKKLSLATTKRCGLENNN